MIAGRRGRPRVWSLAVTRAGSDARAPSSSPPGSSPGVSDTTPRARRPTRTPPNAPRAETSAIAVLVAGTAHRTGPGAAMDDPRNRSTTPECLVLPEHVTLGEYPTADRRPDELGPSAGDCRYREPVLALAK